MFDLEYVVNEVWRHQRPLRTDRILDSGIELHLTATDVDTTEQVDLSQLTDDQQIRTAILASSRLPWLAGPPVSFRGRRLLDPTLSSAIPIDAPRRTTTDMLVLQTRPHGVAHSPLSGPVSRLTVGYLGKLNPALVPLLATRSARYDRLSAELAAAAADPTSAPAVCVIRPPAHVPRIGQMENRADAVDPRRQLRAANRLDGADRRGSRPGQRPTRLRLVVVLPLRPGRRRLALLLRVPLVGVDLARLRPLTPRERSLADRLVFVLTGAEATDLLILRVLLRIGLTLGEAAVALLGRVGWDLPLYRVFRLVLAHESLLLRSR